MFTARGWWFAVLDDVFFVQVMSQAESHLRAINTAIQVTQCQVSAGREQVLKLKQRVSGLYGKLHARLEVEERGLNRQLEQAYQQAHKAAAEVADRQQLLQVGVPTITTGRHTNNYYK